jgi:Putative auto-transporter adhesin, head GIN domain
MGIAMLRVALAAGLILLAASQLVSFASADTQSKTLAGKKLALKLACPAQVDIQPDADLADKIEVDASADGQEALDALRYSEGETVRIEHRAGCGAFDVLDHGLQLTIRVPKGTPIEIAGNSAVRYEIGETRGPLKVTTSGAADLHVERITALDLDSAGAADIKIDRLDGPGVVSLKGGGEFTISDGAMPSLHLESRGAGDVRVEDGQIGLLDISIAGAGNAEIHAPVQDANLEIVGLGNIEVEKATGKVNRKILGIGNIEVGS